MPPSPPRLLLPSRRVSLGLHPLCLTPNPGSDGRAQLGESWRGQESGSMVKRLPWLEGPGPSLGAGARPARVGERGWLRAGKGHLAASRARSLGHGAAGGREARPGPGRCTPAACSFPGEKARSWGALGVCRDARCSPRGTPACRGTFGGRRKAVRDRFDSRVFSNTTVQSINSSALSLLHSPTLTSIHDHRKNHSLDCFEPCIFCGAT